MFMRSSIFLALITLLAPTVHLIAQPFEGTVTYENTTDSTHPVIRLMSKGDFLRLEINPGTEKSEIIIVDQKRMEYQRMMRWFGKKIAVTGQVNEAFVVPGYGPVMIFCGCEMVKTESYALTAGCTGLKKYYSCATANASWSAEVWSPTTGVVKRSGCPIGIPVKYSHTSGNTRHVLTIISTVQEELADELFEAGPGYEKVKAEDLGKGFELIKEE